MGDLLYPTIPDPIATTESLLEAVNALKQAVELLNGQRAGTGLTKAVTSVDLQYVFGTSTPPPGTVPPPIDNSAVNTALAAARLAVQRALSEMNGATESAITDLENSTQTALTEFQQALDDEVTDREHGDHNLQLQVDSIILTNNEGATAAIAQETLFRIEADEALAADITTLSGTVDGNVGAITDLQEARVDDQEALAIELNTITAVASKQRVFTQSTPPMPPPAHIVGDIWIDTVNGNMLKVWDGAAWTAYDNAQIAVNTSSITSEAEARANQDVTIGHQIETIELHIGDANVAISDEAFARAQADSLMAQDITTLQGDVGDQAALIQDQLGIYIDADTTVAAHVTTLETTVGGHTTTINEHTASLNGLYGEYSLTINANGHIAGFQINSHATLPSNFIVTADKFQIVQDTGGVVLTPFTVLGGKTYINSVIVKEQVISDNYAQDGAGNPTLGFKAGSDGLLRAYDARFSNMQSIGGTFDSLTSIGGTFIALSAYDAEFVDFTARGGVFTERPVLLATPNFRNGVPEGLPSVRWVSPGSITVLGGSQLVSLFARTPDSVTLSATQTGPGGTYTVLQTFMVPPGHRLPPRMVADLPGDLNTFVWQDDGTIDRVTYNSNGAVTATVTAPGKWMFDVERDPLNLARLNKMICGLGYTRYAQPLRIPEFLANGTTLVTKVSFKCWGAGGGHDENSGGQGGPGGYVAGSFTVSDRSGTGFLKHGDMIYLIVGEGGRSRASDVVFGFGGAGQSLDSRSGGGGLSGVFRYSVTRANAMLIAGGGGGQTGSDTADGGPGGAAASGGNGTTPGVNTDAEVMTGLPWSFSGSNQRAGGGGGYVGGGYLPLGGNPRQAGRGGSNFVHASATSSVNGPASGVNSNGNSTTSAPPNSTDTDLTSNDDCLGNAALAGRGKTSTVQAQQGGNGLIVVTFA